MQKAFERKMKKIATKIRKEAQSKRIFFKLHRRTFLAKIKEA
jgi:hypothetical protein